MPGVGKSLSPCCRINGSSPQRCRQLRIGIPKSEVQNKLLGGPHQKTTIFNLRVITPFRGAIYGGCNPPGPNYEKGGPPWSHFGRFEVGETQRWNQWLDMKFLKWFAGCWVLRSFWWNTVDVFFLQIDMSTCLAGSGGEMMCTFASLGGVFCMFILRRKNMQKLEDDEPIFEKHVCEPELQSPPAEDCWNETHQRWPVSRDGWLKRMVQLSPLTHSPRNKGFS